MKKRIIAITITVLLLGFLYLLLATQEEVEVVPQQLISTEEPAATIVATKVTLTETPTIIIVPTPTAMPIPEYQEPEY